MPIIPLFPGISPARHGGQEDFEREVAARFGLVPNFFRSAPDAPFVVRELWRFAKSAYLDTPIPTLFKERLFVYLSRFCEVRYCITRHCGFLLGLGRSAGDPDAEAMTISQVVRLLRRPVPTDWHADAALARLEALAEPTDWPSPETSHDEDLLTAATVLFLQPARAGRAKHALRIALGGERFELLVGFLTFVRSAHYWTLMHPEIELEHDVKLLLREHQELAQLLSEDPDSARCEMGTRLFEELEALRDLNERKELEVAKRALEESVRQKDVAIIEIDHRVKNSLQIVSDILRMQARTAGVAADHIRSAAARVAAVAAVHQQLHKTADIGTVALDRFLTDLCLAIATASSSTDRTWALLVDADPIVIDTGVAVPIALIVNELITNAIRHSRPGGRAAQVDVMLRSAVADFSISVSDPGDGPLSPTAAGAHAVGLGTQIVDSLARQLGAAVARGPAPAGYAVTVTVPHAAARARR